jgi:protein subunit release factor A
MKTLKVEIRAGEGGEDAQIFVGELYDAYLRLFRKMNWQTH